MTNKIANKKSPKNSVFISVSRLSIFKNRKQNDKQNRNIQ